MPRSLQWTDLYQIWFRGSPRGRNQMCGILLQSAHEFRFCEGSNSPSPIDLLRRPYNTLSYFFLLLPILYRARLSIIVQASKQASLFAQLINKDIISMNHIQGQAVRKAHKAQHCWPPCKKIIN